ALCMIAERPHFCLAHLTLEALSAHGIHSGQGDATHDVLLVRDANGLPALPGSSLAGVLRHAYSQRHGQLAGGRLFGQLGADAQPSWLSIGWGLVHDSQNQPCEGLTTTAAEDPLLALLQEAKPLVRQRVRLNHTGTAADTGKFDVTLIPAGVRYSTWLSYWCDGSDASRQQWNALLELLNGPLRLGHGTRSGNGLFQVRSLAQARWDLRTPEGRQAYVNRPRRRAQQNGLQLVTVNSQESGLHVALQLQAEAGWRVGGGERSLNEYAKEPMLLPQHELRIVWANDRGRVVDHFHL